MKTIPQSIFAELVKNYTLCEDSSLEQVSLTSKTLNYEFSVYMDSEGKLTVEDFRSMTDGYWDQFETTEPQKELLIRLCQLEFDVLEEEKEQELKELNKLTGYR
ncbi:MAG: hypothetical protein GY928_02300 [Colwellia sp.]|nr:hypothetical protein [Colwellia sp.]